MSNQYVGAIQVSEKNSWILDDILTEGHQLDLSKQFIPLSGPELNDLSTEERLLLSQLMASSYTYIINIVEEFIVDLVMKQFSPQLKEDQDRSRALARFLDEEVKHQQLFSRFNQVLSHNLKTKIELPNNGLQFSKKVLEKSPLSVWLISLQAEVMTHYHYTEIFRSNQEIDSKFVEILKFHWIEESQHVRIDLLEIERLTANMPEAERIVAANDFIDLLRLIDIELNLATDLLLQNFKALTSGHGRKINEDILRPYLLKLFRHFLIYAGLSHPAIIKAMKLLDVGLEKKFALARSLIEDHSQIKKVG